MVERKLEEGSVDGNMSFTSRFKVHTPLLAVKSVGRKETYVTLSFGTLGEILDTGGNVNDPGFVTIRVDGEMFYTFTRDLRENATVEPAACQGL